MLQASTHQEKKKKEKSAFPTGGDCRTKLITSMTVGTERGGDCDVVEVACGRRSRAHKHVQMPFNRLHLQSASYLLLSAAICITLKWPNSAAPRCEITGGGFALRRAHTCDPSQGPPQALMPAQRPGFFKALTILPPQLHTNMKTRDRQAPIL